MGGGWIRAAMTAMLRRVATGRKKTKPPTFHAEEAQDSATEAPPGWIDVEIPVAARRALSRSRYLTEAQRAALAAGIVHESGEYMTIRIESVEAERLAADVTHVIVHGRRSTMWAEVLDETASALERALGIR
jgi:hypothetical protein